MKKILPLLLLSLFSCSSLRKFSNKNVCFLLYDLDQKKFERVINEENCRQEYAPASTFKVPLSLMAFDAGVLKDESTLFPWNKKHHMIESWNKDHTAASWMRDSVVWYSQVITPKLGQKKITKYLQDFKYGNADMTGGLKWAWLTPSASQEEKVTTSLKVSAYGQLEFWEKFWRESLPVSPHAIAVTKKILVSDISEKSSLLQGKTGSGYIDDSSKLRLGWFVGHVKAGSRHFIVVTNFTDKQELTGTKSFGGPEAKEMTKVLLKDSSLW